MNIQETTKINIAEYKVGQSYSFYGSVYTMQRALNGQIAFILTGGQIRGYATMHDNKNADLMAKRAFEPGIFVGKVTKIEKDLIHMECITMIFGKPLDLEIQ